MKMEEPIEEMPEQEGPFDINKWIAFQEQRQQGMGILVPSSPEEIDARLDFVTVLKGPPPDIRHSIRAAYHMEFIRSVIEDREMEWNSAVVERILRLATSLKTAPGHRAKQIEEMAKMTPKAQPRRSIVDAFLGRR